MRGTVDGLILREVAVGESDKLLTVLTAEHGRIFMSAKGVRSMKSKHLALCRVFTYGNFEYYERGGKRWLAGGSVNDGFFGLNTDVEGFALASYVAEIAAEITGEGVDASEILRATLNTLYAIEKKLKPLSVIKGAYELFAAFRSGYEPELSGCRECGAENAETFYLDVMGGSVLCQSCMSKKSAGRAPMPDTDAYLAKNILIPMSPSVTAAARYVAAASPARIFAFEFSDTAEAAEFSRLGEIYLQNHLERGFDTLNFLKMVLEK